MDQPYPYKRQFAYRYIFVSHGKERIEKVVLFSSTPIPDLYNMGFGDLEEDGSINDYSRSNNGDLVKVLSTVIHILKTLYHRILKTYYDVFNNEFVITALVEENNSWKEVPFDPASPHQHSAFLIKKLF